MFIRMNKPSCYDTRKPVKNNDILIANTSEFGLTEGKIYLATQDQGYQSFPDSIWVVNDNGDEMDYSSEYFCHYEGELVLTD